MTKELIIIKTTFSEKSQAKNLAKNLLAQKLAACVQISKIESFYIWKNKFTNSEEILVEIKTKANLYKKIEEIILQNHEYEIPQILAVKVHESSASYDKWVSDTLK
ncbi:MAG TPA: divalent-cation tolerance protein CutA [Rickettsiales bacterium]|nr:divalent-cation tolerance protein CutA [Rickettsiales bacterium]